MISISLGQFDLGTLYKQYSITTRYTSKGVDFSDDYGRSRSEKLCFDIPRLGLGKAAISSTT